MLPKKISEGQINALAKTIKGLEKHFKQEPTKTPTHKSMTRWIEENLLIKPKRGGLQPFKLNKFQKRLVARIVKSFREHKPVRLIVLKSRQLGISTLCEAVIFYLLHHYPNTTGLVVAHRLDSAKNIFAMTKRFWHGMDPRTRRSLERGRPNRDNFMFEPPHSSQFVVLTAGGDEIGRGWTLNFVHVSELAFYQDPETTMTALNQAVPKVSETEFSLYIIESTANGLNLFKDYWDLAHNPDSVWEPIFFSWRDDETARIKLGNQQIIQWSPEEHSMQQDHGLSEEQMLWARRIREDQCNGSWAKFHQEYPVTPDLAFLSTGFSVFNLTIVSEMIETAKDTDYVLRGDIEFLSATKPIPKLTEEQFGPLTIWEHPQQGHDYVLGVDTAEGIGGDYSEIIVMKKDPAVIVAHYRNNRIAPQDFGVKAWLLGAYYHYGLLGIERNTIGQVVLAVVEHGHGDRHKYPQIMRYPHLYYETVLDRKTIKETAKLGFTTSSRSKDAARVRFAEIVKDDDIVIYSLPLLYQMRGYVWDPDRKSFLQQYKDDNSELYNDDAIMAASIANEMRIYEYGRGFCPRPQREDW